MLLPRVLFLRQPLHATRVVSEEFSIVSRELTCNTKSTGLQPVFFIPARPGGALHLAACHRKHHPAKARRDEKRPNAGYPGAQGYVPNYQDENRGTLPYSAHNLSQ